MESSIRKTIVLSLTALMLFSSIVLFNNWIADNTAGAKGHDLGITGDNVVWAAADNPHYVDDNINITGNLTIEPGVIIKMNRTGGNVSAITVKSGGKLVINGSWNSRVSITSNTTTQGAGNYTGIVIESGGIAYINYTNISHATIGVDIDGGNTEVNHCVINETSDWGIEFTGNGAPYILNTTIYDTGSGAVGDGGITIGDQGIIDRCTVYNSMNTGIKVSGGSPVIANSYIHNASGNGLRLTGSAAPFVDNCNISNSDNFNIYISGTTRDITFYNTTIGYRDGGVGDTIKIDAAGVYINLTLLNSSFVNNTFDVDADGNISINYYVNVYVNNSADAHITGATVNMVHNGSIDFTGTTDGNGKVWLQGTHFNYNNTGDWIIGNYTVNVTHPDYQSSEQNTYVDSYQA
ncbi:MAG: right-handed parallel beta-helix repeat-containing protein, partial [Candidatus Thermoplasmatota archaeon]|nr:right-handed parallel beta-helix repeat-containing protein [Candidatus Thermoplasmatota archaeon]